MAPVVDAIANLPSVGAAMYNAMQMTQQGPPTYSAMIAGARAWTTVTRLAPFTTSWSRPNSQQNRPPFLRSIHAASKPHSSNPSTTPYKLPHLTQDSEVHMVNVTAKDNTHRVAAAVGLVKFSNPRPGHLIAQGLLKKGDVMAVARIAGLQAIKKTSELIPLAHNTVPVEGASVQIKMVRGIGDEAAGQDGAESELQSVPTSNSMDEHLKQAMQLSEPIAQHGGIRIGVKVETTAKTGVEMEALTGVVGTALTIVDMVKSVDRDLQIQDVRVIGKKGGRSGGHGCFAA